jgi:hypothetical protein
MSNVSYDRSAPPHHLSSAFVRPWFVVFHGFMKSCYIDVKMPTMRPMSRHSKNMPMLSASKHPVVSRRYSRDAVNSAREMAMIPLTACFHGST